MPFNIEKEHVGDKPVSIKNTLLAGPSFSGGFDFFQEKPEIWMKLALFPYYLGHPSSTIEKLLKKEIG